MPPLEMTPEQIQELLDALQVGVVLVGIAVPFLVGAFLCLLLLLMRR